MGNEQTNASVGTGWPGGPAPAPAVPRQPIDLPGDTTLVRTLTRSALWWWVTSRRGVLLAVVALGLGYLVTFPVDAGSWWRTALAAAGLYLVQVLVVARALARTARLLVPVGAGARSWYDGQDVLVLQSGTGRTDFRRGSLQEARRHGAVTTIRLRRTRRVGFVPSRLLTDEDLAFLVGSDRAPVEASQPSAADLPLLLVATDRTVRDLRRAVVVWTLRRPQSVLLLAYAVALLACARWLGDSTLLVLAALLAGLWGVRVVASHRVVGRGYRPGTLVRAALTPDALRLRSGDDLDDTYPLAGIRRCHVGRHHVRLDLGRGRPHLFLPRDLLPPTELAALQRRVSGH